MHTSTDSTIQPSKRPASLMKKRMGNKKKLNILNESKSGATLLPQIMNTNSTRNLPVLPQIFNNNDPYNIEADAEPGALVKPKQRIEVFKSVLNGIERKASA